MDDLISRQAAIEGFYEMASDIDHLCTVSDYIHFLERLPSAELELENKIRAIGYTGREGRIYIGGRLFAVRELPQ